MMNKSLINQPSTTTKQRTKKNKTRIQDSSDDQSSSQSSNSLDTTPSKMYHPLYSIQAESSPSSPSTRTTTTIPSPSQPQHNSQLNSEPEAESHSNLSLYASSQLHLSSPKHHYPYQPDSDLPKTPSINTNPNITPYIPTTSSTIVQYPIEEELRGKRITGLSPPNSLDRTTSNYNEHQSTPTKLQYPNLLSSQLEHDSNALPSTLNPINIPSFPNQFPQDIKMSQRSRVERQEYHRTLNPNSLDSTTSNYHEHQSTPTKLQYPNPLSSQLEHDSNSLSTTTLNLINISPIPTTSPTTLNCSNEVELRGKSITGLSPSNSLDRTTTHYHEHQSKPTKLQYPNHLFSQLEHDSNSLSTTTLNPINTPSFPTTSPRH